MGRDYITGLIIRDNVVEWTTLLRGKSQLQVAASGRAELTVAEPSPTEPAGDEAKSLAPPGLKAECARIKGPVGVGLRSDHILLRVVDLPSDNPAELKEMAQLQVDKFSPFPLDSMVISHEVLGKTAEGSLVLIAAVRQDIADALEQMVNAAGLLPICIDASVLGWCRLLKDAGLVREKGAQLVLLMDGASAEIVVFQDGSPRMFRSLSGLQDLTGSDLDAEAASEIGRTLMSLELEHGISGCVIDIWFRGTDPAGLAEQVKLDYGHEVIRKPLSDLPSLSEGLARRLTAREQGGLDLTPPASLQKTRDKQFKRRILMSAAAGLGLWLLCVGSFEGGLFYQRATLHQLEARRDQLKKPAVDVREMRRRVNIIKRYMDRTGSPLECLREMSSLQPPGVDLTSFSFRKDEGLKISGEATSVNLVYEFKKSVDASPLFRKNSLQSVRQDPRSGRQIFDMDLALPGGAE